MSELKSSYSVFTDENLVVEFHKGILTAENYINFKKELMQDSKVRSHMNYLINFQNSTFKVSSADIQDFAQFMSNRSKELGKRKIAFITKTPNQVVNTTIYTLLEVGLSQTTQIFSTLAPATKWLNIAMTPDFLENLFNEMGQ
jgi:hypothetical protein